MLAVDLAAGLGRGPVVRAAVGVQARRQPPPLDDLGQALEARRGAFLLDEEHRVVLRRRIVQGDDEVPILAGHPLVGRTVLMQHHPRKWRSLAATAVFAPPRRLAHQARTLQRVLHPGVAALAPVPAPVEAVEVPDVPPLVALAVQRLGAHHLVDRRAPRRDLPQALVHQPDEPLVLVAVHVAPERALTHPQQPGRLLLRQPPLLPSPVGFLESHPSDLLQHLCSGHRAPPRRPSNRTTHVLLHRTHYLLLTPRPPGGFHRDPDRGK